MPIQDNKSKMAVPTQPKDLARKLINVDISKYVVGPESRDGLKKFSARHPALRRDQPNNDPEENEAIFGGSKVKDDTTRRADYELGQDEIAYDEGKPQEGEPKPVKPKAKKKIVEKYIAKVSKKVPVEPINAQKKGSIEGHGHEYETAETKGDETSEPQQKKPHVKVPPQVLAKEAYLYELGEPMAPAPATSDSPGWSGDTAKATDDSGKDSPNDNDHDNTDGEPDESVTTAKDQLETIATAAAELYENIQDNIKLPSWVLEKLDLAKNFVMSVSDHVSDAKDEDEDNQQKDDGSSNKDNTDTQKPSAFKGNGEQSLAKEDSSFYLAQRLSKINLKRGM